MPRINEFSQYFLPFSQCFISENAIFDHCCSRILLFQISLNSGVESCTLENKGWCLETTSGTLEARTIVNCGGLYGDRVDSLGGIQNFR